MRYFARRFYKAYDRNCRYGNPNLNDSVTITQDILSKMKDGKLLTFYAGEVLSVKDLLHCMVLDRQIWLVCAGTAYSVQRRFATYE
jgi:hypothetical protein